MKPSFAMTMSAREIEQKLFSLAETEISEEKKALLYRMAFSASELADQLDHFREKDRLEDWRRNPGQGYM